VRERILERFEKWLDGVLAKEKPLDEIGKELLRELAGKDGFHTIARADNKHDLYSTWSSITALTQEIKLQGRAFKRLGDKLEPLSGIGESIDMLLESQKVAQAGPAQLAGEVPKARTEGAYECLQDGKKRARREILNILIDIRDRLVLGLRPVRENRQKIDEYLDSNLLSRILSRQRVLTDHMLDIVKSLEKGYRLSLERLDEAMQQFGISEITCEEQPFDPRTMKVVDIEETAGIPDGTVLEVYRTGYMMDNEVLYPAHVKVARSMAKE